MAQPLTNFDETQYHGVLGIVPEGCAFVPEKGRGVDIWIIRRLAVDLSRTCPRRYTAASFVGSIALQGSMHMDAMGGSRLVKPLMWLLRHGSLEQRHAACRALAELAKTPTCTHTISQVRGPASMMHSFQRQPHCTLH